MKTTIRTTYIIFVLGLVLAVQAFAADVSDTFSLGNYQLINKIRVDRVNYDYVFKASATNKGAALKNVSATLVNPPSGTSVMDSALSFGDLAAGATAASSDTFSFRQNRLNELKPENLQWQISGEPAIANSGTISGIVADTSGGRVANAEVRLGTQTVITHTDDQGDFTANFGPSEISDGHQVLVSARASGYVDTQTKVALGQGAAYNTSLVIKHVGVQQQIADPSHASVSLTDPGKAVLQLDAGSILDSNNQPVTEPVKVQLTALDPTNPAELSVFPGRDFLAIDPSNPTAAGKLISIKSVVFAEVKLLGDSGSEYHHWSSTYLASLDLAIPDSLQGQYANGQAIPLWYYDDTMGLWKREGNGEIFLNPTDNRQWVKARVNHFSDMNLGDEDGCDESCTDNMICANNKCLTDVQYQQYQCEKQKGYWAPNNTCWSSEFQYQCVAVYLHYWYENWCWETPEQYYAYKCGQNGGRWNWTIHDCYYCPTGQHWEGDQCVSCPEGKQWDITIGQCVDICQGQRPYWANGGCWESEAEYQCMTNGGFWQSPGTCWSSYAEYECMTRDPPGYWGGGQCFTSEVERDCVVTGGSWDGVQCSCPNGKQLDGSQCVFICPSSPQHITDFQYGGDFAWGDCTRGHNCFGYVTWNYPPSSGYDCHNVVWDTDCGAPLHTDFPGAGNGDCISYYHFRARDDLQHLSKCKLSVVVKNQCGGVEEERQMAIPLW